MSNRLRRNRNHAFKSNVALAAATASEKGEKGEKGEKDWPW